MVKDMKKEEKQPFCIWRPFPMSENSLVNSPYYSELSHSKIFAQAEKKLICSMVIFQSRTVG